MPYSVQFTDLTIYPVRPQLVLVRLKLGDFIDGKISWHKAGVSVYDILQKLKENRNIDWIKL